MPPAVIRTVRSRLVSGDSDGTSPRCRLYRPLVVGPAILRGHGPEQAWTVRVSEDGRLLPLACPRPARERPGPAGESPAGRLHRVAAALVAPQDFDGRPTRLVAEVRPARSEFYGWALLYQLPGMRGVGVVDPHERFEDLPAFFESPGELVDREAFLAKKGVLSRPLALFTQPADFVVPADGRLQNRFYPGGRFRRPADPGWFR